MALRLSDLGKENVTLQAEPPKKGGFLNFAKGVGVGFLKDSAETIQGLGTIGNTALQQTAGRLVEKATGRDRKTLGEPTFISGSQEAAKLKERLKANQPGEGTGKFLSATAQFLLPTKKITQAQSILGNAAKMVPTRVGQAVAGLGARFAPEAAGTGAVSALRSGGDVEQAKDEGLIAGAFTTATGALGKLARATYWPLLDETVSKALGSQGKKSAGVALNEQAQKVAGLQVLKNMGEELSVTLDDGTKAAFDTGSATYNTTLQAWNEARKKIYNRYSALSEKVGDAATVDLTNVRQEIINALDAPALSVYKNAARSLLKDLDDSFEDITNVDVKRAEQFLESLNSQTVSGFFKGTSDAANSTVNAGTARLIRERLDDLITESTGEGYQELRTAYSALKSIEDDLVRKFQQNARSIGGGLPEYAGMFASGDVIGGLLSAQPGQVAKGGIIASLAALKRKLADPERFLRRSFQLIDNEAPSDLYYRLFGGTRALNEGEKKIAREIGESAAQPGLGLSTRDITRSIPEEDINFMDDFAEKLKNETASAREIEIMDELAERYGFQLPTSNKKKADVIGQIATSLKERSFNEATDAALKRSDPDQRSFNQGATPSTNLLEEAKGKSLEEFIGENYIANKPLMNKGEGISKTTFKLDDVLDNPVLFEKYPVLRDYKVHFAGKPIGTEAAGITGRSIRLTDRLYDKIPDQKKIDVLNKKLQLYLDKEAAGTLTDADYKAAAKIQDEISDLENGKDAVGVQLNEDGMRALYHEIQHAKQGTEGYVIKDRKDFISETADYSDNPAYWRDRTEVDARFAETKWKSRDELEKIWKEANR